MKLKTYKRVNGTVTRVVPVSRDTDSGTKYSMELEAERDFNLNPAIFYCPKTGVANAN